MIQITITFDDKGALSIAGTTHNPVELYGLLGMAANAIGKQAEANAAQAAQQRVQLAPAGIMGLIK